MDPSDPRSSQPRSPWFDEPDDRESVLGFVPEFVKKVAVAGLGALFMTEEGIRNLAGQLKLPKEVLGLLLAQADKTKDEISRVISDEVRRFLQSERLREEVRKLLSGTTVEIQAHVRLVPDASNPSGAPELKVTHLQARRPKRAKKD